MPRNRSCSSSRKRARSALSACALGVSLALGLAAGCKRDPKPGDAPPPPAELLPDAALRPDSALSASELWRSALAAPDDALELARLAEVEGATGLLVGLEEGGAMGLVALSALPYAEDAELAAGRLAEILPQLDPAAAGPVLDALEGIALRPRTQTEPLNPLGLHAAFDALVAEAKRPEVPAPLRARAVSIGRLIASRGPYDPRLLPADFDR